MSIRRITFAKAGTAALALAFIMALAGCPTETEPVTPALSGAITISPNSGVITGTQLTADYSGTETGITWQWNKDGNAISGATAQTYTPAAAGSCTVTVNAAGYAGKTSAPVSVTKAPVVSLAELADHIAGLPQNTAENPHTVKLAAVNISTSDTMGSVNTAVTDRYITLDLSACSATGNTISGSYFYGSNDMSVIHDNQYIVGVILPGSLTSIGDYAFAQCSSLASVTIPEGLTSIGREAFVYCTSLASVTIPGSVTSIGREAFVYCTSLASVTIIPGSLTSIGGGAFYYCTSLASVTIPEGVTSIGDSAFTGCANLVFTVNGSGIYSTLENGKMLIKNSNELAAYPSASGAVTLPASVTSIGSYAFSSCSSLASVTIPGSVTSIGYAAFSSCSSLASVTILEGVTSIGWAAFSSCYSLASVTIPGSLTSIEYYAFDGCANLVFTVTGSGIYSTLENGKMLIKNGNELAAYPSASGAVTLPASVTSIGSYAFAGRTSLASVTIPDSVTSIGDQAFSWCSSLASVTIPEGVTSIGGMAFYYCTSLASVTIPGSVTSIGEQAFSWCSSLASVTFAAGSNISEADFAVNAYNPTFPGDLRTKYLAGGGGPGTYTAARQDDDNTAAVWTKQQ